MILSKSKSEKLNLESFILDLIKESKHEEFLLVAPTNRRVRRLKKWLIQQSPGQKASVINLHTLKTLSENLLLEFEPFHPLSEASASVFIEQCISKINLTYFNGYKNGAPFGTIEELRNVISEFKRHGITPDLLKEEAVTLERANKNKLLDIANIYEEYLKITLSLKAYELGDVYSKLTNLDQKTFSGIFRDVFPFVKHVFVIGFDEFTKLEVNLLNKISAINSLNIFIELDYYKFNPAIFGHVSESYENLIKSGFREAKDLSIEKSSNFQNAVRQYLFLNKKTKNSVNLTRQISIIGADNRVEEIEKIAREIKKLILFEKVKPSRICLAFNVIGNYSHYVRDVFDSLGVPFNLTDRISLSKSLPITALINLLAIIESNYYFKNVLRAFNSYFVEVAGVNINSLTLVSRKLNIVVGIKHWKSKILEELNKNANIGETPEIKEDALRNALDSIENIEKLLSPFSRSMTIEEFLTELKLLIKKINLTKNIFRGDVAYQETNIKSVTTFIETIEEIFKLIEQTEGKQKQYDLRFFLSKIRTAARFSRFNIKERPDYGVLITSLNEIRGLTFDYLFIGGMVDGDFPTKFKPEIFKPGRFSSDEWKHLLEERFLFYQSLTSWKKKLYFSYPKKELKKDLSPSVFLLDFKKLFNLNNNSAEVSRKLILSKRQLFEIFDRALLTDYEKEKLKSETQINVEKIIDLIARDKELMRATINKGEPSAPLFDDSNSDEENSFYTNKLKELKERVYSVSQLETYALCPFKYFVERILKVQTLKEPSEEIEPLEVGNLLHKILFEFYVELKRKRLKLANCSEEIFQKSQEILFDIAEKEIAESPLIKGLNFYEREKILGIKGERRQSILYKFLEYERKNNPGYEPAYFETVFGFKDVANSYPPLKIENVKLRGIIDRIEISMSGEYFDVVDYKTGGRTPSGKDVEKGLSLQLPVYLAAASNFVNALPRKMFIYSLKYSSDKFGKKPVFTNEKKSDDSIASKNHVLFNSLKSNIPKYVNGIAEGRFNLSSLEDRENKICYRCDLRAVCRVDEF